MVPPQNLVLNYYDAQTVLVPAKPGKPAPRLRITIYGENFPQRALEPEILVGGQLAQMVKISRDQRSIRGYLRKLPPDGSLILVRYGQSQEGVLEERFSSRRVRPLPKRCTY